MRASHVFWNAAGLGIPLVIAAITVPALLERIGTQRFGLLTLAWSLIGYAGVLDLGVGRAVTQKIASMRGGENESLIPSVLKAAIHITLISGLVGLILVIVFDFFGVTSLINANEVSAYEKSMSFLLIGITIPIQAISATYRGVNEAYLNFRKVSLLRMVLGATNFGAPLFITIYSIEMHWLIFSLLLSRVIALYFYKSMAKEILPKEIALGNNDSKKIRKELMKFGGWITLSGVLNPIVSAADRFLIATILSASLVASYVIPYEMVVQSLIAVGAITTVFFPYISNLRAKNSNAANKFFVKLTIAIALFMLLICILYVLFGGYVLRVWIGKNIDPDGFLVLKILSLGLMPYSVASMCTSFIHGHGRADITGKVSVVLFPISLGLLYFLLLKYGLCGAAFAWVIRVTLEASIYLIFAKTISKTSE